MNIKIRLRADNVDVRYEGDVESFNQHIGDWLKQLSLCHQRTQSASGQTAGQDSLPIDPPEPRTPSSPSITTSEATVNTIAARMDVAKGPDLIIAAVASLSHDTTDRQFSRQLIHDRMKDATTYYRPSYGSNLSSYLKRLVKTQKLNEVRKGVYALSPQTIQQTRDALQDILTGQS